jgi:hypothetical protein
MNSRHVFGLALGLVVASCSSSSSTINGADSGGGQMDSGTGSDTGPGGDTGTNHDTGTVTDTGSPMDTGSANDTGTVADTGSGGDTGMGGDTGSGACTDAMDMATMGMATFQMSVQTCAQNNLGQEPGTSSCIMMIGLTSACTMCVDTDVHCIIMNCLTQCMNGPSPACTTCQMMSCDPAFHMCSGV